MLGELLLGIFGSTIYDILKSSFIDMFGDDSMPLFDKIYSAIDASGKVFFNKFGEKYGKPNESFLARQSNIELIVQSMYFSSELDLVTSMDKRGYGNVPELTDEALDCFINELRQQMSKDYALDKDIAIKKFMTESTAALNSINDYFRALQSGDCEKDKEKFLSKVVDTYKQKIDFYLSEQVNEFPLEKDLDYEILKDESIKSFFEEPEWKKSITSKISTINNYIHIIEELSLQKFETELREVSEKKLTYREFYLEVAKLLRTMVKGIPKEQQYASILSWTNNIFTLLNKKFNKIALIVGEAGEGKTYLLNSIIRSNGVNKDSRYFSFRIPVVFDKSSAIDIEGNIVRAINHFMGTDFESIHQVDELVCSLQNNSIKVVLVIDDLQDICLASFGFFEKFKTFIEANTVYEWLSYIISINEYELYLVFDNTTFLDKYCFRLEREYSYGYRDTFATLITMSELNAEYKTCKNILGSYGIDSSYIEEMFEDIEDTKMLLNNPLITHVYANTVEDSDKELLNIRYFEFIKRFAEIKKSKLIQISERALPSAIEIQAEIEREMSCLVEKIVNNKTLEYAGKAYFDMLEGYSQLIKELQGVHLVRRNIIEDSDFLMEEGVSKTLCIQFIFKLYWGYKVLLGCRDKSWQDCIALTEEFPDLRKELLSYIMLYLDLEKREEDLKELIIYALKKAQGREVIFLTALKTNFKFQAYIFNLLLTGEYHLELTRAEIYSLLYFLTYTNAIIPNRCIIIGRHLKDISRHNMGFYLDGSMRRILNPLENLTKLKKCIAQFIPCLDVAINQSLGEIAAEQFYAISGINKLSLEDMLHQFICFVYDKSEDISKYFIMVAKAEKSNRGELEEGKSFAEYFIRKLFKELIKYGHPKDKMLLHRLLLEKHCYFNEKQKQLSHIIRTSAAIEYGNYYWREGTSGFKEDYLNEITQLVESELEISRLLAYHFISNTLFNDRDSYEIVDKHFIPLLKELATDKQLEAFCKKRKEFFKRNFEFYEKES